jgi:hypothetical protein
MVKGFLSQEGTMQDPDLIKFARNTSPRGRKNERKLK